eukprot:gene1688-33084_t
MRIVGLTGGIASGKSTASNIFAGGGITIIDCDKISHNSALKGNWGWKRTVKAFGQSILLPSGEIDRKALGRIIFSDASARRRLNAATHLPVLVELLKQILWHWLTCKWIVVIDMPLLFETGSHKFFRPSVLVACHPETQVSRLMLRDACTAEEAKGHILAQMPLDKKLELAGIVVQNDGSLEDLQQELKRVARKINAGSVFWGILTSPFLTGGLAVITALVLLPVARMRAGESAIFVDWKSIIFWDHFSYQEGRREPY